ncbi:MAG: ATP-dependent helicase [Deltaproteobacteria bacterium]|jgi:DNA helicase-2/ATP-dependent DNA helicase PcrA|nr:ATP-dependent helicase [Deltaproteobacteria bacterium]
MLDLSYLNDNQIKAVKWNGGPLLVLGGPGSGKTRVLTYRIAKILEDSPGKYFRLLALTITNKAAAEIRAGLEELVPNGLERVCLTTFHSYLAEVLRKHGHHVGINPNFQILYNDADREALLKKVIGQLRNDVIDPVPPYFEAHRVLPIITRLQHNDVPPVTSFILRNLANNDQSRYYSRIYIAYSHALRQINAVDYPSLPNDFFLLIYNVPVLVTHIRKVYKHILVDEFQDTNLLQYNILKCMVEPDPSTLFVVADGDQIIYQWNGASPERINDLKNDFDVSEIQLPENYRCPREVIKLANSLIVNNPGRSAMKMLSKAVKSDVIPDPVRLKSFSTLDLECKWIVSDIKNRNTIEWSNCVVLARTRKLVDRIYDKFVQFKMPVYKYYLKDEFVSAPFKMLNSVLRLIITKEDTKWLTNLSEAFFELEGVKVDLSNVSSKAFTNDNDLLRAWLSEILSFDEISEDMRSLLSVETMSLIKSADYKSFSKKFISWAKNYYSKENLNIDIFNEFDDERQIWEDPVRDIDGKFRPDIVSLNQFLHELDLSSKSPPKQPNAVSCFTIHSSKGMEFKHVYLMGLVEEQLPNWWAVKKPKDSEEVQEERRNCFVAITRTQESLTLTYSDTIDNRPKLPSRFLKEMGLN